MNQELTEAKDRFHKIVVGLAGFVAKGIVLNLLVVLKLMNKMAGPSNILRYQN